MTPTPEDPVVAALYGVQRAAALATKPGKPPREAEDALVDEVIDAAKEGIGRKAISNQINVGKAAASATK